MATQERLYDVDDLWDLLSQLPDDSKDYELIDGALIEMTPPGGEHGQLTINLGYFLRAHCKANNLGIVTAETGYHPADDRQTLLGPDIAFVSHERAPKPFPKRFVPVMPDLAVEIKSPSNTLDELREKAQLYLRLGSTLVWIVRPDETSVEACRLTQTGEIEREVFGPADALSGGEVLPGFTLDVRQIFE